MENLTSGSSKICQICLENRGVYVCPRCNVLYCSVQCYRSAKHVQCSEEFYKECISNELSSMEPNTGMRIKMEEILKRINEADLDCSSDNDDCIDDDDDNNRLDSDDNDGSEGVDDLHERLKDVNLDDADKIWEKLNDVEKMQFEKLLESGDISNIVPEFEPWWCYRDERKVIDLEGESDFEKTHKSKCPKVNENIVSLSSISKSPPAPVICYNLVNVLTAFAFTIRYYNGDHHEFHNEATATLILLSKNILSNENFTDFDSAIQSVVLEVTNLNNKIITTSVNSTCNEEIRSDVLKIMHGPDIFNFNFYILAALCDIHSLFSKSLECFDKNSMISSSKTSSEFSKRFPLSSDRSISDINLPVPITKQKIKNCLRKIVYYQSWVVEFYDKVLSF